MNRGQLQYKMRGRLMREAKRHARQQSGRSRPSGSSGRPRRAASSDHWVPRFLLTVLTVAAGCTLLVNGCGTSQTPQQRLAADLASHPGYDADMNALVAHLSANDIAASWPGGYGEDKMADTIYLSMAPSETDADAPALAARVYGKMTEVRRKDGYGDRAGECFVHVLAADSARELAVDRMGLLQ